MKDLRSIPIRVDGSQFPDVVHERLVNSLRTRQIQNPFHYTTYKQAARWQEVYRRFSPFVNDPDCQTTYDKSFSSASHYFGDARAVTVVGLGCGTGKKDIALLRSIQSSTRALAYAPVDVSLPLLLTASQKCAEAGIAVLPGIISDLLEAKDFSASLDEIITKPTARLYTFFGMVPNFEPQAIFPVLSRLVQPGEWLLLSANLVKHAGDIDSILPQYDNALTAEWLLTFLFDLGIEPRDGRLRWAVERDKAALPRIAAHFDFERNVAIEMGCERFEFQAGEHIRLFFSYRYTRELMGSILSSHGFRRQDAWITGSGEEGIFLCQRV